MTDTTQTALIPAAKPTQSPTKRKPGPRSSADVPVKGRLTPLIRAVVHHKLEDRRRTITEIAAMLGCTRTYISRQMHKPHVKDYFAREEKRHLLGSMAGLEASATLRECMNSPNERVRFDAAKLIEQERGTLSRDTGRGVNVNVAVKTGLVIHTRRQPKGAEEATVIDHDPPTRPDSSST